MEENKRSPFPIKRNPFHMLPLALHGSGASAWARLLYSALLYAARGRCSVVVSQRAIAGVLRTTRRTIERCVVELLELGLIAVQKGLKGRPHRYELACSSDAPEGGVWPPRRPAQEEEGLFGPILAAPSGHPGRKGRPRLADQGSHPRRLDIEQQKQDDGLAAAFRKAGIEPPSHRVLAREFPAATPALIEEALTGVSASARGGARVQILRATLPELLERKNRLAVIREQLDAFVSEYAAEYERNRAPVDAAVEHVDEDEWTGRTLQVLIGKLGGSEDATLAVRQWRQEVKLGCFTNAWKWMLYRTASSASDGSAR